MNNFKKQSYILLMVVFLSLFFTYHLVKAETNQIWGGPGIWEGIEQCRVNGDCRLDDVLILAINIGSIIIRFVAVAVFVMFVYGGVVWVTSGGSSEKVGQGKKIITSSLIGLLIVLAAGIIINELIKNVLQVNVSTGVKVACYNEVGSEYSKDCPANLPWPKDTHCGGNNHGSIEAIQQKLNDKSSAGLDTDGCLGPETWTAIENFANAQKIWDPAKGYTQQIQDALFK